MHLTICCLLQFGQLNTAVPFEFVTLLLHEEQNNFSFAMFFRIGVLFIKVIVQAVINKISINAAVNINTALRKPKSKASVNICMNCFDLYISLITAFDKIPPVIAANMYPVASIVK